MKEALLQLEKSLPSKSAQASVDLLCKLLSNVVDNPGEPKYRSVKRENKKVKELLTGNKHGERLMTLVGFTLVDSNPDEPGSKLPKDQVAYKLNSYIEIQYLKGVKLELQGAFSEI